MALKKTQEREFARALFVSENQSQKTIAIRVGVTEKTVAKWILEGNWKKLKTSLLTTKQNQLSFMYDQLDWQNTLISMRDIKVASSKEADVIMKLTASIEKLETETGVGETVAVGRQFIEFVSQEDLKLAKEVTRYFDLFIQTKNAK